MSTFVVSLLCRSLVLTLIALSVAYFVRRKSASVRHAVAVAVVLGLLALPFLSFQMPVRTLPILPVHPGTSLGPVLDPPAAMVMRGDVGPSIMAIPRPAFSFANILFPIYLLGVALLLLRLTVGLAQIGCRLARARREQLRPGTPAVFTDRKASVPMTAWLGRHFILLPEDWRSWSDERLDSVLLHEQAHIRRGDWFWLVASYLALAFYWPNPLVWRLNRDIRSLSEQAADDFVLASGVLPSRYAQDLLNMSRSLSGHPAPALYMAEKAEVARRIEMVLNAKKTRGSVTLLGATLAGALLLGSAAAVACLALRPGALMLGQGSTSMYDDVRSGKTIPGTAANGFTGVMSDGRKARLVQVSQGAPGQRRYWAPDGTPIKPQDAVKHGYSKDQYLHFLVEFESDADVDKINGGLGSGPHTPNSPSRMTFSGGWVDPYNHNRTRRVISLIGVAPNDGERCSFTFGVSDTGWTPIAAINPKRPAGSGAIQEVALEGAKGPFPWEKWNQKRPTPSAALHFVDTSEDMGDRRVVAFLKNGKQEIPQGNWSTKPNYRGSLKNLYFLQARIPDIDRIEIQGRKSFSVELLDVALKPKSDGP